VSVVIGAVVVGPMVVLGAVVVGDVVPGCVGAVRVFFELRAWRPEGVARIEVDMSDLLRAGALPDPHEAHAEAITSKDKTAGITCLEPDISNSLLR
jgi:hypothetical protein